MAPEPGDGPTAVPDTVKDSTLESSRLLRLGTLKVVEGVDAGRQLLVQSERVTIGRAAGNDLVLSDPRVSAIHIEVTVDDEGFRIRDLESTNGVTLGTCRIVEARLGGETRFGLGASVIQFTPVASSVRVPLAGEPRFGALIGASALMRRLYARIEQVAPLASTVLIEGETGSGKEEVAREIHARSTSAAGPFQVLDCTAIPRTLAEAILFGVEAGAFTGADRTRPGIFESAEDGTVLLDEIGELAPELQPKLLRVLEGHAVTRLGDSVERPIRVRVLAATHRDLARMVNEGRFRADLYYRLAQVHLHVPPLRARGQDVGLLAEHFLGKTRRRPSVVLSADALGRLERYGWPGNVRELRNVVTAAAELAQEPPIGPEALAGLLRADASRGPLAVDSRMPFKDARAAVIRHFQTVYLTDLVRRCGGNLAQAAREARLASHYLQRLLERAGIVR